MVYLNSLDDVQYLFAFIGDYSMGQTTFLHIHCIDTVMAKYRYENGSVNVVVTAKNKIEAQLKFKELGYDLKYYQFYYISNKRGFD